MKLNEFYKNKRELLFTRLIFLVLCSVLFFLFSSKEAYSINTSAIIFYYGFDNADISGSSLTDQKGNFNMQILGSPTTGRAGLLGQSFVFDGVDDFLRNLTHHAKDSYNAGLTYNIWVNLNTTASDPTLFIGEDGGASGRQQFVVFADGTFTLKFGCGGACEATITFNGSSFLKTWTMLTMIHNSSGDYLFKNGVFNQSVTTGTLANGANDLWIGADKGEASRFLNGTIDEFSAWNKTGGLNATDISDLYNSGTGFNPLAASNAAPAFSENKTNNTAPKINENVNFSIVWTDDTALSSCIFSYDNGTATFTNDSATAASGTNQTCPTIKTIQRRAGVTIQWKFFANDSSNAWNETPTYSVVVADTAATFTSNTTNNTAPKINQNVNFSIVLTDADTLSHRIFSYDNGTGTFVNDSAVVISGTSFNANVTKTIERIRGVTIQWRWFLNDTAGNSYVSTTESIVVADTSPTAPTVTAITPVTSYANDTLNSGAASSTDADGDAIYYYMLWNTSAGVTLVNFTNTTGFDSFNCANPPSFANANASSYCNKSITVNAFARAVTLVSGTTNSTDASQSKAISDYVTVIQLDTPVNLIHTTKNGSLGNALNFSFYPYDADIGKGDTINCNVSYNASSTIPNLNIGTNSSVSNANLTTINSNTTISNGRYLWGIQCSNGSVLTNSTTRTIVIDSQIPTVTFNYPILANTTKINSTTLNLNIQCSDTNLERANMTLSHAGNGTIISSNLSTNITSSPYNQNASISLAGQNNGNYTVEMSCADDVSESPDQPNYHADHTNAQFFYQINYTDIYINYTLINGQPINVTNVNYTLYFEITNPALKTTSLSSRDLQINTTEDGRHIKTSWCVNVSPAQKVRHIYVTNNDKKFEIRNASIGHFTIGDKFVHYKEDIAAGYNISINEFAVNNNSEVHVYLWKETGWDGRQCTSSAITGGLNTVTETSTFTLDTQGPSFATNITNNTAPKINQDMQFNVTWSDNIALSNCTFSYDNGTGTFVNDTAITLSGTSATCSHNKTIQRVGGTTLQWIFYARDTADNINNTPTYSVVTANTDASFTSNSTNKTNPKINEAVQFNITLTDADSLVWFIFAWDNGTSTLVNDSVRVLANTSQTVSVNKTIDRARSTTLTWKWYVNDSTGAINQSGNYTLTVANTAPLTPSLLAPGNNSNQSAIPVSLQYNTSRAQDADNDTITYFIFINGTINGTGGTTGNHSFNASDSTYIWLVVAGDTFDNSSNSSIRQFILDDTGPTINLTSPVNASSFGTSSITFFYNVTDLHEPKNCSIWIEQSDGFKIRSTNSSPNEAVNSSFARSALENGLHYWMIQCADNFNNTRNSTIFNFTISLQVGASAGGGGGGGAASLDQPKSQQIQVETERTEDARTQELLLHINTPLLGKLFPNYKEGVPNDKICSISEDPIFSSGKNDCRNFNWRNFTSDHLYYYSWVSRYLVVAMAFVSIGPMLFGRAKVKT